MNLAYFHLVANHFPIVGIPVAFLFYVYHLKSGNKQGQRFSLIVLGVLALVTVSVFFSGESAEEAVEGMAGVLDSRIEYHEDNAKVSLISCILLGVFSLFGAWAINKEKFNKLVKVGVIFLGLVSMVSLARTGYTGGKIRHSNDSAAMNTPSAQEDEHEKANDD